MHNTVRPCIWQLAGFCFASQTLSSALIGTGSSWGWGLLPILVPTQWIVWVPFLAPPIIRKGSSVPNQESPHWTTSRWCRELLGLVLQLRSCLCAVCYALVPVMARDRGGGCQWWDEDPGNTRWWTGCILRQPSQPPSPTRSTRMGQ